MSKHTEGEWSVDGHHLTAVITKDKPHKQIAVCSIKTAGIYHTPEGLDEAKANAQRIVKACNCHDELLEALQLVIKSHEGNGELTGKEVMSKVRAAIKKAGGASNSFAVPMTPTISPKGY